MTTKPLPDHVAALRYGGDAQRGYTKRVGPPGYVAVAQGSKMIRLADFCAAQPQIRSPQIRSP